MVLRLFVPPGEGQYEIIPKRPDPIGANATLQYCIVGSTALAATYTSFASSYGQRVTPSHSISKTALFIRSSARLGLYVGAAGAAINWYYHSAFVGVVASEKDLPLSPWNLYQWTKTRTVEDGCLAGAAVGLVASIPMLFIRRPAIPRWTRCLGMTNIGACAGILGAHGYLQYTGERQKAYKRFDRRLKRRSLEFREIFWDKMMMAQFSPLIQQYIRHNGIWYTSKLPRDAHQQPDNYDGSTVNIVKADPEALVQAEQPPEEQAYYVSPYDYADDLKQIDVESTRTKMEELKAEKQALLEEAEYLTIYNVQKQYEYCHTKNMDDDERRRRLQEIHLCEIAFNRVWTAAHAIDIKLIKWSLSLQHKAITEAHPDAEDTLESWLPPSITINYNTHDPAISVQEMEKFQTQIAAEVKKFEELIAYPGYTKEKKALWKRDLEDGRVLLRAADRILWELEKTKKALERKKAEEVVRLRILPAETSQGEKKMMENEEPDRTQLPEDKAAKPSSGSLEPDKP